MWVHRDADWVSNVVEGTWESRTVDELAPQEGDIVIPEEPGERRLQTPISSITSGKSR